MVFVTKNHPQKFILKAFWGTWWYERLYKKFVTHSSLSREDPFPIWSVKKFCFNSGPNIICLSYLNFIIEYYHKKFVQLK